MANKLKQEWTQLGEQPLNIELQDILQININEFLIATRHIPHDSEDYDKDEVEPGIYIFIIFFITKVW